MTSWEDVREIVSGFPEVEESGEGRSGWRVRGKLFAWQARERDGGGLAVRVDKEDKELFLGANPDVYFTSPHYDGYPALQMRLEEVGRDELQERLEDAWVIQAPKRLAKEFLADADAG